MAVNYCYLNLTIRDMMKSAGDPKATGNFFYGTHSFDRVEICGTVVSVREYDEKNIYLIDDCFGVIPCHEFKTSRESALVPQQSGSEDPLPSQCFLSTPASSSDNLEEIAARLENSGSNRSGPFKLGDFLLIRGQLKEYCGTRRVWVHFSKILDDPNLETFYMVRQLKLYKNVYDCVTTKKEEAAWLYKTKTPFVIDSAIFSW